MATVIENMTGVQIKSPFFSDLKTLELFPDISKSGTSSKRNRVALLYGTNGSGKSTLAQGFREYAGSTIPRTVDVVPMAGANQIKLTLGGKPERIHVFDESYISDNIKLQRDGLGSIILFGHQVQIEKRVEEIETDISSVASKIQKQEEACNKYVDTNNVASPSYWLTRIIRTLQRSGGWAETDGIQIKKHQIKARVRLGDLDSWLQRDPKMMLRRSLND